MTARSEVIASIDRFKDIEKPVTAPQLRHGLNVFVRELLESHLSYPMTHRTTRGTRLTFADNLFPDAEFAFEVTGRKNSSHMLYGVPADLSVTSVRTVVDPARLGQCFGSRPEDWYRPMPMNLQFANGGGAYRTREEDLVAVFQDASADGISNGEVLPTRQIEPFSQQAAILGQLITRIEQTVVSS